MPSLIEQLREIEGLDSISAWPLAIGWIILIPFSILMLGTIIWLLKKRFDYLKSWQREALKSLSHLEQNLSSATSNETIASLSEYLRRIAIKKHPRKECAGLIGIAWLNWLKARDPKQYDWTAKGKPLIEIPYAPTHTDIPLEQIKELIQAARHWVN